MNNINITPSTNELFIPDLNFRTLLIGSGDEYKHSHDFIEVFYVLKGEIKSVPRYVLSTFHTLRKNEFNLKTSFWTRFFRVYE